MLNRRRRLNSEKLEIYRNYKEGLGEDFTENKGGIYRIADEVYDKLFPVSKFASEGFKISGKSTLYNNDGEKVLEWVKTSEDKKQKEEQIQAIIEGMNSKIERVSPKPFNKNNDLDPNIINQYTITDFHLGMMAWGEESGDDWDIKIAEDFLITWFKKAIETSPNAKSCIFAQIGDMLHWDGIEAVTPSSGHVLDADTRITKLIRVSIRVIRQVIDMLLDKYESIHLILAEGNHDLTSSIWLRETFSFLFENEPRVTVDINPDPYYAYSFGSTLLFYHHGHKRKPQNIDTVFVSKFKDLYGKSKNVYAHMGHLHNLQQSETNLMIIEQHRTLASKDSYASRGGWMSGRDAKVITYSKEYGEVARVTINSDIIKNKK